MRKLFSFTNNLVRHDGGSVAIEFALVGSLMIVLTLGTFEAGRYLYMQNRISNAVGRMTRLVSMGMPDETLARSIGAQFSEAERSLLRVSVLSQRLSSATFRSIEVRYDLPAIIPGLHLFSSDGTIPIRILQLIPEGQ